MKQYSEYRFGDMTVTWWLDEQNHMGMTLIPAGTHTVTMDLFPETVFMLSLSVYGANNDRVLVLYGLRRTGKTTLVRQLIGEMDAAHRAKTAFVQVNARHTLADVNHDLKLLESQGFKYVFVEKKYQDCKK